MIERHELTVRIEWWHEYKLSPNGILDTLKSQYPDFEFTIKELAASRDSRILSDVRSKIDTWIDCDIVEIIIRGNDGFDGQEGIRGNVAKTEFKKQIGICFE